jgi:hypothetical protein
MSRKAYPTSVFDKRLMLQLQQLKYFCVRVYMFAYFPPVDFAKG